MAGAVDGEDGFDEFDGVVELVGGFEQRDFADEFLVLAGLDGGHVGLFFAETEHFVAALDVFAETRGRGRHHLLEVAEVVLEAVDDVAHGLVDHVLREALLAVAAEDDRDVDEVALEVFDLVQAQQLLEGGRLAVQDVVEAVHVFVLESELLEEPLHEVASLGPEVEAGAFELSEPVGELEAVFEEELVLVVLPEDLVEHQGEHFVLFGAVRGEQEVYLLDLVAHVRRQLLVDVAQPAEHLVLAFGDVEGLPELLADVSLVVHFDGLLGLDGHRVGFLREEPLEHLDPTIVESPAVVISGTAS